MTDTKDQYQEVIDLLKEIKARHDSQDHQEEHEFLRQLIKERKMYNDLMQTLKVRLLTAGIWGIISVLGFATLYTVKHWLLGSL